MFFSTRYEFPTVELSCQYCIPGHISPGGLVLYLSAECEIIVMEKYSSCIKNERCVEYMTKFYHLREAFKSF